MELARITKHKKPRHQLYFYGFNESNSCWMCGRWVTFPKEEWEAKKDEHCRLFGSVKEEMKSQHHSNKETSPKKMTKAQRMAWQHYSGDAIVTYIDSNGTVGFMRVPLAGGKVTESSFKELRKREWKVPRKLKGNANEESNQTIYGFPEDLYTDKEAEAIDPWDNIIKQNKEKEDRILDEMLDGISADKLPPDVSPDKADDYLGFTAMMVMQSLIELEETIIRIEWYHSVGIDAPRENLEHEKRRYAVAREKVKKVFGDMFDPYYEASRNSSNECARANLDNSKGTIYSYVLPKFHDDGTHEPWGEKDVPWGAEERKKARQND